MLNKLQTFKAILKNLDSAEITIAKSYNAQGCSSFSLYENGAFICDLEISSSSETSRNFIYQVTGFPELKIDGEYEIYDNRNVPIYLDCSCLARYDKYVDRMYCPKEMGAIYSKESTTFRVFAPSASVAVVNVYKEKKNFTTILLTKDEESGTFEGTLKGDYDGYLYSYLLKINNQFVEAMDPYAKAVNRFSRKAFIIDPKKVEVESNRENLPPFSSPTDAIIYEMSVRDITSDKSVGFINKGKYFGLLEENIKTRNGNPAGMDYLKSLGVTHVQLQPVFDFCTTNDEHPEDTYNWGYDPLNFNVPEGSFSINPNDPYSRIIELKKVIQLFHKNGIRVVMDVVYNHLFNQEISCFEQTCPNYYFRYNEHGEKSNGSFCGNDFESRHLMARKFIVDSCKYWTKEYDIDGFRFDLMGIIDIKTMQEVTKEVKKLKPDSIIYGEGWDMPTMMPSNQKASMLNANALPDIGFFNDRYRETSKGKTDPSELFVKGYLSGDTNYIDGFKHIFAGSCLPLAFPPLFSSPTQSINYVECHDNHTLFDKLKVCCYDEDEQTILKRIKLFNACIMLSEGVPFFHMGQEIGLTKKGVGNSYNSGDDINQFKYQVLDKRKDLYKYFIDLVKIRKEYSFLRLNNKNDIEKSLNFVNLDSGALAIEFKNKSIIDPYQNVVIFINPSKQSVEVDLDDYYQVVLNETGRFTTPLYAKHLIINSISVVMVIKK